MIRPFSLLKLSFLCLIGILLFPVEADAASYWKTYMPPELAYADDLKQRVTVPEAINVNKDGLPLLKTLPGFSEDLALKVIRNRPFTDIQDFYRRIPALRAPGMQSWIQQLQPKVIFK